MPRLQLDLFDTFIRPVIQPGWSDNRVNNKERLAFMTKSIPAGKPFWFQGFSTLPPPETFDFVLLQPTVETKGGI